jgi:predicted phage terminase large subunit-like protein
MQYDTDLHGWQGSQMAFIGFDELTHFSRRMFFYMMSRARTGCGVNPYIRATMNPDPDSWVREFIDWYIGPDGLVIPDRSGVVRYFAREKGDKLVWADDADTLIMLGLKPKSFTFIGANVSDNPALLAQNPDYVANLEALPLVERERLLGGNWNIRPISGMVFKRHWFKVLSVCPNLSTGRCVRYWDRASSEVGPRNTDPDWTVGLKMHKDGNTMTIVDVVRVRLRPEGVLATIKTTAQADGEDCEQWLEEDPGQAGKAERAMYYREMEGGNVRFMRPKGSKYRRALPASAQAEAGNIRVVNGPWLSDFFAEVEKFADWDNLPDEDKPAVEPHDDQVDGLSGATAVMLSGSSGVGIE